MVADRHRPAPPIDNLAVELFLNGNMCHGRRRRGAMPVLLAGREPDHITRPDFLGRTAFALDPAAARRDDERLTERVRMPRSPGPRLINRTPLLHRAVAL